MNIEKKWIEDLTLGRDIHSVKFIFCFLQFSCFRTVIGRSTHVDQTDLEQICMVHPTNFPGKREEGNWTSEEEQ